nr:hypothetical protein CFP56_09009 [Quercus suber]
MIHDCTARLLSIVRLEDCSRQATCHPVPCAADGETSVLAECWIDSFRNMKSGDRVQGRDMDVEVWKKTQEVDSRLHSDHMSRYIVYQFPCRDVTGRPVTQFSRCSWLCIGSRGVGECTSAKSNADCVGRRQRHDGSDDSWSRSAGAEIV